MLGGFTGPAAAHAGGPPPAKAAGIQHVDPVETLMRLSTEHQQQMYALRLAVEQLGSQQLEAAQTASHPSRSRGVGFASVGALVRSVPTEVILNKFDTELTDAASTQWMEKNTRGRSINADLVIESLDLDQQKDEIVLKAMPFIEPYGSETVEATVVCRFATRELNRMTHLREGMRIRVQGVIDQAFFTRKRSRGPEGHALKVYVNYARLVEDPVTVIGVP